MKVLINGEKIEVSGRPSLSELLRDFSFTDGRIAIELNKVVVRRNEWSNVIINDADRIEIIHFVGGG
jgi:sulfur carrier protein